MRLRRAELGRAGFTRRRRGRGVIFLDVNGHPIRDEEQLARLRGLAIPPAWRDVWISPYPNAHIQATGIDAAGRKQYLYHPLWRVKRDEAKFDHLLEVATRLPALREQIGIHLAERGLSGPRVLAAVASLLDLGALRVGNDEYAMGDDPTFGVSTLRPEHARFRRGYAVLVFPAKGGQEQVCEVTDAEVCAVLHDLRRRRRGTDRLFAYWEHRSWREVRSDEVNEYLRQASGGEMTAKDFRTWHATVRAATQLAAVGQQRAAAKRRRAVAAVMRDVASLLGNTPTVARASYVDPRVVDLYHEGVVVEVSPDAPQPVAEEAVLRLLTE
jgi:DNA topoisomerase-1